MFMIKITAIDMLEIYTKNILSIIIRILSYIQMIWFNNVRILFLLRRRIIYSTIFHKYIIIHPKSSLQKNFISINKKLLSIFYLNCSLFSFEQGETLLMFFSFLIF